ncbi:MAG: Aldehyde Dehydrogenase [Bacteroidetes bacterium]|nr:Aldehyde Dehydrogenase [Bacteroidota bacterium]
MNYEQIITAQRVFFNSNATKDNGFRKTQLRKLRSLLVANERRLYDAIYADFKKSEFETAETELLLIYHEIDLALKNMESWSRKKKVPTNLVNFPSRSYIIPEPLGVTLVIGAWNYPYQLSLAPAVAAIAAGNTVILKPSEIPANTAAVMASIINENFPANYFHVVEGGVETSTALLECKFDKIFFTGSTSVGKIVYEAAAKQLTPVTLELGGKSPAIVMADCNMEVTVQRLAWAKFLNAGQTCIAPDYVLIEASAEKRFLEVLGKYIERNYGSSITENYVQIINDKNMERLLKLLDVSKVVIGGSCNKESRYFAPTVMRNVSFDDAVMQEEIFGPILPVIAFTDLNEVIANVKERPKPLSCFVFSTNSKKIKQVLNELSFGGGAVNDALMHISNSALPFGGVGNSGMGNYHGEAGFKTFSHYKSILHKSSWLETGIKYPPYAGWKQRLIKWMMR